MIRLENILVATDFSEPSDTALEYGRARERSGHLHVLHVVENSLMWAGGESIACDFALVQADLEEASRKKLEAIVGPDNGQPPKTTIEVKSGASPAVVIVDYAKDAKTDLIIMGTHGRGLVGHLFVGSVAERVVRIAPCPVLTLKNPEHEFVLPDALETVGAVHVSRYVDDCGTPAVDATATTRLVLRDGSTAGLRLTPADRRCGGILPRLSPDSRRLRFLASAQPSDD
jgi:nucleotide-binding universal stress UspA family protein